MKKKWWIGGIVIIVILGVLVGYFAGQSGSSETATPSEEKSVTVGTIQVPEGPKIKVVFSGPPELKVNWEKVGMAADGFQIQLIGTLKNVSDQAVKFSEIGFLFDGQQVAYIPGRTLSPGETMKIAKGFPGYSESTKVLEVKIKNFQKIGDSATTPEPTKAEVSEPTKSDRAENVYIKAPNNPQTPSEIVAAFFFLCSEGKYQEALELTNASEKFSKEQSREGTSALEGFIKQYFFHNRQLKMMKAVGDHTSIVYYGVGTLPDGRKTEVAYDANASGSNPNFPNLSKAEQIAEVGRLYPDIRITDVLYQRTFADVEFVLFYVDGNEQEDHFVLTLVNGKYKIDLF